MPYSKSTRLAAAFALAALVVALAGCSASADSSPTAPGKSTPATPVPGSVTLNDEQAKTIEVNPVSLHVFSSQRTAVGNIDFNENLSVQVFSPYQGKIIKAFTEIGDDVKKGQPLYTIDSPDLVQAESTLITAAGVYDLDKAALDRARPLLAAQGIARKDYEQAVSDETGAESSLKAAHDAVRMFGKSEAEINSIVSSRRIDPVLMVPSPISGRITARAAQPGLLVQPGSATAPYSVADVSTMWMLADVAETDSPLFRVGQNVRVKVMAFPDHDFSGKISVIGATVDPATHTTVVRSEVSDPKHELRPGMFATYVIQTGDAINGIAVPQDGVVRETDGTQTIWVTTDRHHFTQRTVQVGRQQDGFQQITQGVKPGEQVAAKGAVFLSNMLNAAPDD